MGGAIGGLLLGTAAVVTFMVAKVRSFYGREVGNMHSIVRCCYCVGAGYKICISRGVWPVQIK